MKHIAIDFEYNASGDKINHLICAVLHGSNGAEMRFWLRDGRDTDRLIRTLNKMKTGSGYCLIAHAMELAEARCFKMLGLDPTEFSWRDTWMECRLLANSFFSNPLESCSLVECLAKYCDIQVDVEYKKECRAYCIADSTENHEQDILDYCASDTKYLPQLAERTLALLGQQINNSGSIHRPCQFSEDTLIELAFMINCASEIASRGFPVDNETCALLRERVPQIMMKMKEDFNVKYPGTFQFSKLKKTDTVKATKKSAIVYDYLEKFLAERGVLDDWEKTKAGRASTDSGLLKDYKGQPNFAGDLYSLNKNLVSVQGLGKDKESWLQNWSEEDSRIYYQSLRPMTSSTGRCQPQISKGFVPGWAHFLYCVLNPPKGKWIIEIDFHAQETALQAIICQDEKYAEVYNARDTYLWMAWQLGQMTDADYNSFPGDDKAWKEHFGAIRKPMKTFTLAWSYGAGAKHLAALAGIPEKTSEQWVYDLNHKVFANAFKYKTNLCELTKAVHGKYQGLCFPDGFCSRTIRYKGETPKSDTVKMNYPFQGGGAYILRQIIKECHRQNLPAIATVHDAVMFEIDAGDEAMIQKCIDVMSKCAANYLGSDMLACKRKQVVVWKHHTLSDILDADLSTKDGIDAFVEKVGDLVEVDDVRKFQKFMRDS